MIEYADYIFMGVVLLVILVFCVMNVFLVRENKMLRAEGAALRHQLKRLEMDLMEVAVLESGLPRIRDMINSHLGPGINLEKGGQAHERGSFVYRSEGDPGMAAGQRRG